MIFSGDWVQGHRAAAPGFRHDGLGLCIAMGNWLVQSFMPYSSSCSDEWATQVRSESQLA